MEIVTDAIVLRNTEYKDNDLLLTLFSVDGGKLTASAKGVKKAGAKLNFAAQPFCFAQYVLAQKNGRNTVISASLNDSFYNLRTNLFKFYGAYAAAEFCDKLLPEESASPELFLLFANCIKDLCYSDCPERGVVIRFFIDALNVLGYKTHFANCGNCGKKINGGVQFFDFERGTVTCSDCACGRKMSESTLNVICSLESGCYVTSDAEGERRSLRLLCAYIQQKIGITLEIADKLISENY